MGFKVEGNGSLKNPVLSLKSSFTLLKHYSGIRGTPFPNIFDWLEGTLLNFSSPRIVMFTHFT